MNDWRPLHLPANVMAMNDAVFPHFTAWLAMLCSAATPEEIRVARDRFLWSLHGQSKLRGVTIPWDTFLLEGIRLPWDPIEFPNQGGERCETQGKS